MVFCTIITPDYIHYALAVRDSLLQFQKNIQFYIFVSAHHEGLQKRVEREYEDTFIMFPDQLCSNGTGKDIYDKYYANFIDGFRWSIKPVLLSWLLEKGHTKVVYVDCDIQFYADYAFLFDELEMHNVLLTPHWRSSDPVKDEFNFSQLYIYGLYNGGFIAVNQYAKEALEWWARANYFICEVNACKGQFVDQTHLNLLPVYFDKVRSLQHRGCNVAGWNLTECRRTADVNGQVLINDRWPVVFVHFSDATLYYINNGEDSLLKGHLDIYTARVNKFAAVFAVKPFNPAAVLDKASKPAAGKNGKDLIKFIFRKFQSG